MIELVGRRAVVIGRALPWTKTHKNKRSYRMLTPATVEPSGQLWLGCVTITQTRETEVYLLDEIAPEHLPPGWRKFYFVCQSRPPTPDRPGAYALNVDTDGYPVWCECTGSVTRKQGQEEAPPRPLRDDKGNLLAQTCKHKDVIADLFDLKFFEYLANPEALELPTLY